MTASNSSTLRYRRLDAAHHLHPFTDTAALNASGPRVIVKGEGVWLTDSDGKRYLDGMAGLWCVNIGHGRPEIAAAVERQMRDISFYNTFFKTTHPPVAELSELVTGVAPDGFNHVFFCNSGSEANDTVLRMVRTYWAAVGQPGKQVVIARKNAYHGSTIAGASLSGMKSQHADIGLPIPGIHHIAQPYWFGEGGELSPAEFGLKAARALEQAIEELGEDKVAAFIAEPIQGAGGVIIPPDSYWPEIAAICRRHDILLVTDEVISGFGRLGTWFGCQHYGVTPDLMPVAKGLSSGYLPIAGVLVSDKVATALAGHGEFHHGFTYSGHPVSSAAAIANLNILKSEKLVERVAEDIGPYLRQRWLQLADHPLVGEARMTGLMGALELVPAKPARHRFPDKAGVGLICRDHSFNNGLIMRAVGDTMVVAPPFVLSHAEADELIAMARRTLDMTLDDIRRRGLA
jgi:putrescine aminotransferase